MILMLGGGDKSSQQADITKAIALAATVEEQSMSKKIRTGDLPEFDMAEHLQSEEEIATYLTLVLEENDPAELAHALGVVARARGMAEIAEASGLTREALYKALRPNAKPRFDTIARVCQALGVRLVAQPIAHA
jgi:probable addiction module antidote protein